MPKFTPLVVLALIWNSEFFQKELIQMSNLAFTHEDSLQNQYRFLKTDRMMIQAMRKLTDNVCNSSVYIERLRQDTKMVGLLLSHKKRAYSNPQIEQAIAWLDRILELT